jgi:hypothetical protein
MQRATYLKFAASQKWKGLLLATGDRQLVYVSLPNPNISVTKLTMPQTTPKSPNDGIGFSAEDAEANRERWGQNLIGIANMKARQQLQDEEARKSKRKEVAEIDGKAGVDEEPEYEPEHELDVADYNEYLEQSDQAPVREAIEFAAQEMGPSPIPSIEVGDDRNQAAVVDTLKTETRTEDEDVFNIYFD